MNSGGGKLRAPRCQYICVSDRLVCVCVYLSLLSSLTLFRSSPCLDRFDPSVFLPLFAETEDKHQTGRGRSSAPDHELTFSFAAFEYAGAVLGRRDDALRR